MKRTPIKRYTPLKRAALKPRSHAVRKVSKKLSAELRRYSKLRKGFLETHPLCEALPVIWPTFTGLGLVATEVHHTEGRGKNLNRVETWLAVCRHSHEWIHNNPGKARKLGLLK